MAVLNLEISLYRLKQVVQVVKKSQGYKDHRICSVLFYYFINLDKPRDSVFISDVRRTHFERRLEGYRGSGS